MATVLFLGSDSGIWRHDQPEKLYQELAQRAEFDSVLPVVVDGVVIGSSVLIDSHWLLSAKHVLNDAGGKRLSVRVDSIEVPIARLISHQSADLALFELSSPIISITPASLYTCHQELNQDVVSVGYGLGAPGDETFGSVLSQGAEGTGIKRAGMNTIDLVDRKILQADFDHPGDVRYNMTGSDEALALEYLPMKGDSGGGLFGLADGGWKLFGITLSATSPPRNVDGVGEVGKSVAYGWIAQWHRVSSELDWIQEVIND